MGKHGKPDEPPDSGEFTRADMEDLAHQLADEWLQEQWREGVATGPIDAYVAGYEAAKQESGEHENPSH